MKHLFELTDGESVENWKVMSLSEQKKAQEETEKDTNGNWQWSHSDQCKGRPIYHVAVYHQRQAFGGPEEGGWWYNSGSFIRIIRLFKSEEAASDFAYKLNSHLKSRTFGPNKGLPSYTSVLSGGELVAKVYDDLPPEHFPERRPHYE